MSFLTRNLRRLQGEKGVNTEGDLEVPPAALEELAVDMLLYRDYFISAPWRVMMFDNRIELISPGALPNNLTVENIRSGVSNIRNPLIASYATKELPYRSIGTGILEGPLPNGTRERKAKRRAFVISLFEEGYNAVRLLNETGKELTGLTAKEDIADAIICAWTGSLLSKTGVSPGHVGIRLEDMQHGFVVCPYTPNLEKHLTANPKQLTHSHAVF